MAIPLQITAETLPEGVCALITNEQERLNLYAEYLRANFPGTITGIAVGTTPPDDLSKAWLQLDNSLYPVRLYYYANGAWQSKHPKLPGEIIIWDNALPDFTVFDGGDAGAAGLSSGPMWEEVTALRGKFPLGAGTMPATTDVPAGSGTVWEVQDEGGSELVNVDLPNHIHVTGRFHELSGSQGNDVQLLLSDLSAGTPGGNAKEVDGSGAGGAEVSILSATGKYTVTTSPMAADGSAVPAQSKYNMPPLYVVHFLRRTSRLYYRV